MRPGVNADGTREERGSVNDKLHEALDHVDAALAALAEMHVRAIGDAREDDALNLEGQMRAIRVAGRVLAEHVA